MPSEHILEIARSFPCLEAKLREWHPNEFKPDHFRTMMAGWSHGEILCGLFILSLWNPAEAKQNGWDFDIFEFAGTADQKNREALIQWLRNPAWP